MCIYIIYNYIYCFNCDRIPLAIYKMNKFRWRSWLSEVPCLLISKVKAWQGQCTQTCGSHTTFMYMFPCLWGEVIGNSLHFARLVAGKVEKLGQCYLSCWLLFANADIRRFHSSFISCCCIFVIWITSVPLCFIACPFHLYRVHGSLRSKRKHSWHNAVCHDLHKLNKCIPKQSKTQQIPLAQTISKSLGSFLWYSFSTLVRTQAYVAIFVSWSIFCCTFFAEVIGVSLGRIYRVTFCSWWWAAFGWGKPPKDLRRKHWIFHSNWWFRWTMQSCTVQG